MLTRVGYVSAFERKLMLVLAMTFLFVAVCFFCAAFDRHEPEFYVFLAIIGGLLTFFLGGMGFGTGFIRDYTPREVTEASIQQINGKQLFITSSGDGITYSWYQENDNGFIESKSVSQTEERTVAIKKVPNGRFGKVVTEISENKCESKRAFSIIDFCDDSEEEKIVTTIYIPKKSISLKLSNAS